MGRRRSRSNSAWSPGSSLTTWRSRETLPTAFLASRAWARRPPRRCFNSSERWSECSRPLRRRR
eukprot:5815184-Prorocentrum_lima.AAC.1